LAIRRLILMSAASRPIRRRPKASRRRHGTLKIRRQRSNRRSAIRCPAGHLKVIRRSASRLAFDSASSEHVWRADQLWLA